MIATLVNGVVHCPKCNSPMNIEKARRRLAKKSGEQVWEHEYHWGKQVIVGNCSCGEYVFYHITNYVTK